MRPHIDGGRAIAFVTDITERRQAALALPERTVELERRSAQLSRLASELTLAEQHTREQLAKTLHDGLQQLLVGAAMNLDRLMRQGAHARNRNGGSAARGRRASSPRPLTPRGPSVTNCFHLSWNVQDCRLP